MRVGGSASAEAPPERGRPGHPLAPAIPPASAAPRGRGREYRRFCPRGWCRSQVQRPGWAPPCPRRDPPARKTGKPRPREAQSLPDGEGWASHGGRGGRTRVPRWGDGGGGRLMGRGARTREDQSPLMGRDRVSHGGRRGGPRTGGWQGSQANREPRAGVGAGPPGGRSGVRRAQAGHVSWNPEGSAGSRSQGRTPRARSSTSGCAVTRERTPGAAGCT